MKNLILLYLTLLIIMASCQQKSDHPRILLLEGEEQAIKEQIANNEIWAKMHQVIIDESEKLLTEAPPEKIMTSYWMLGTSRKYLHHIFYLSYAYRMTKDKRYAQKAQELMLYSAAFDNWNPRHFLDVAEMTMAHAIGYDWLYDELSKETKQTIRNVIINKGLRPSFNNDYNWWLVRDHNWNQVCNAGMTFGAITIQEDYPELADSIIERAYESIRKPIETYGPDGAYQEGYSYWSYGTTFNVLFFSALEKLNMNDRGLAQIKGFLESAEFMQHMVLPSLACYNWGDCGKRKGQMQPAMFWFAQKQQNPSLLFMENKLLQNSNVSEFSGNRVLPAMLIWGKDISFDKIKVPIKKMWVGQGHNPIAMMRTTWDSPEAIYLGFKAGSPFVNHGHMDVGSFVMEEEGIAWSIDLGSQDYHSLISKGVDLWNKEQDSDRWKVLRLHNKSHNTLTFNNQLQDVHGYAKIDKYSDTDDFMYAVSDISEVYRNQVKSAKRGVAIKDRNYTIIQDEIETLNQVTKLRWNMITPANIELTKNGAVLTKDGKTLYLKVNGNKNVKMKTWSTAPTTDYDAENPGTILVGFECELPANSKESFEVLLIPEKAKEEADFLNLELEEW